MVEKLLNMAAGAFLMLSAILGLFKLGNYQDEVRNFAKQCEADNGIAVFAGGERYCIKRSAFVEGLK